ncbi:MAG: DNA/RNA nuclease SfsA [Chloroflexi bacterium]|nr:DNA/RNA nuclease SfsA [Chloroflexota bacterium]
MNLPDSLVRATFLSRPNRFLAQVRTPGGVEFAHIPNPGRMLELFLPDVPVMLQPRCGRRKTRYDLLLVWHNQTWVGVDSRLPNALFAEALDARRLPPFALYMHRQQEVLFNSVRLDYRLYGESQPDCLVEVKSVNRVDDGWALFPDAPTVRGVRHLLALQEAVNRGLRGALVFVVQRHDARAVTPFGSNDPLFARTLEEVAQAGVEIYAYVCQVSPQAIGIERELPVVLGPH